MERPSSNVRSGSVSRLRGLDGADREKQERIILESFESARARASVPGAPEATRA